MDTNAMIPTEASGAEPTKKYIRTFESDMAALKQGGVPALTPFAEPERAEPESSAPHAATSPSYSGVVLPEVEQVPMPSPEPVEPEFKLELEPLPLPEPKPEPPPLPEPEPEPVPVPSVLTLETPTPRQNPAETYENDFSDRMKDTHASVATVLAAEQDAATEAPLPQPQKPPRSSRIYVIAGAALLLIGVGGAYYAYTRYATAIAPVTVQPSVSAPIFVDDREEITGVGPALAQEIEASVAKPLALNAARLLYFASSTDSVFSALHPGAPDVLLRNVNTTGSMVGVVNIDSTQSPFFILSVASYSDTFAGMLSWEPSLPRDLNALFPPYPAPLVVSTPVVATTTKAGKSKVATTTATTVATPPSLPLNFKDEVVSNHDVRVYRDAFNQSVLLYGYWNKTTLIIARDPAAFTEIVDRLANSRAH